MITIARFFCPLEAQIARSRLEVEGIPVFILGEGYVALSWISSYAMGGMHLQVPAACVEQAGRMTTKPTPVRYTT